MKLDELIRVSAAKSFFVGIEHLTDDEIYRQGAGKKAEEAAERTD